MDTCCSCGKYDVCAWWMQMSELRDQSRKLEQIHSKVARVEAEAEYGNWILRGMSSWGGALMNAFSRSPKPAATTRTPSAARAPPMRASSAAARTPPSSSTAQVSTRDDALLHELEVGLEGLEARHKVMGSELDRQNERLEDLHGAMASADSKLTAAARTAARVR